MATAPTPRWAGDDQKAYKRTARMRRMLMLSPYMTLVAAICAVLSLAGYGSSSAPAAADPVVAVASSLAEQSVADWVGQGGLPPGSTVMAPTSTSVSTTTQSNGNGTYTVTLVTVSFPVLSGAAVPVVSATVRYTSNTGAYALLGSPSVELGPDSWQGASSDNPWPGAHAQTCPSSVAPAVQAWAAAYFSGDPVRLQQAVGDPDPSHHYVPLAGAAAGEASVRTCATLADQTAMVASVSVPLDWTTPSSGPTGSPSQRPSTVSAGFDVRVDGATGSAAVVTAWSPVGAGLSLAKFSNATTTDVVVAAPSGSPEPLPSPSTAVSPSPSPTGEPSGQPGGQPEPGAATTGQ